MLSQSVTSLAVMALLLGVAAPAGAGEAPSLSWAEEEEAWPQWVSVSFRDENGKRKSLWTRASAVREEKKPVSIELLTLTKLQAKTGKKTAVFTRYRAEHSEYSLRRSKTGWIVANDEISFAGKPHLGRPRERIDNTVLVYMPGSLKWPPPLPEEAAEEKWSQWVRYRFNDEKGVSTLLWCRRVECGANVFWGHASLYSLTKEKEEPKGDGKATVTYYSAELSPYQIIIDGWVDRLVGKEGLAGFSASTVGLGVAADRASTLIVSKAKPEQPEPAHEPKDEKSMKERLLEFISKTKARISG